MLKKVTFALLVAVVSKGAFIGGAEAQTIRQYTDPQTGNTYMIYQTQQGMSVYGGNPNGSLWNQTIQNNGYQYGYGNRNGLWSVTPLTQPYGPHGQDDDDGY